MENQPSISSDLIRGHIDTIILYSLFEEDKFAQQISDYVEKKSENNYKINQATLYSSLKRLENLNYLTSYWHDFDDGRRKFFKITDDGRYYAENNLSSWVYSKSILDKLMNISPVYAPTDFVHPAEKSDTATVTGNALYDDTAKNQPAVAAAPTVSEVIKPQEDVSADLSTGSDAETESNSARDLNFRSVLGGLIKNMPESKSEDNVNRQGEEIVGISDNCGEKDAPQEILKFNDTVSETDYNADRINNGGKIDYGDLTLKAANEGYILRVSSKDSAKSKGKLFINKLNFVSACMLFCAALIELGVITLLCAQAVSALPTILFAAVNAVALVIFAALYFCNAHLTVSKKIHADGILTATIVVFNLILLIFAIGFIAELNFSDTVTLLSALIIPSAFCVNIVLFFLFRFILAKNKAFYRT